jgi:hypothetical protein
VVTFDDIAILPVNPDPYESIPHGYQGLVWSNLYVRNALLFSNAVGVAGYSYGMVSPSNVVFNGLGNPAEIDSPNTNFNFLSVYLTGAWNSNLNIEVQGLEGTNLIYNTTVVASATNATLFTFNYMDIDRLYFNSYGGETAGFPGTGEQFVMDNFTFEFIPEPSSLLLTSLGLLSLWAVAKLRRR